MSVCHRVALLICQREVEEAIRVEMKTDLIKQIQREDCHRRSVLTGNETLDWKGKILIFTYFSRHSSVCHSVFRDGLESRRQMAGVLLMDSSQKRTGVRLEGVSLPTCDAPTVYVFLRALCGEQEESS